MTTKRRRKEPGSHLRKPQLEPTNTKEGSLLREKNLLPHNDVNAKSAAMIDFPFQRGRGLGMISREIFGLLAISIVKRAPDYGVYPTNNLECRNEIQALSSGFTYVGDRPDEEPIAEMVGVKFTEQTTVGPEVQQEIAVPSNLGAADDIFLVEVELGEEK
ncbi:hypothetical protein ACH5RR_032941 [Cinchona calisaya]|uniref:Uncharacterized protein n=1 Tax=Cinchona calisaya TaxID=153742 RepID=A0ABD2YLY3_9GENT